MKPITSRDEREAQAALQSALEARTDRLRAGWLSVAQDWFELLAKKPRRSGASNVAGLESDKKNAPP